MTTTKKTEVTKGVDDGDLLPVKADEYAVFKTDPTEVAAILKEASGTDISLFDLDRVKVPAGGGQAWELQDLEGTEVSKTFEGIVALHRDVRAYWEGSFEDSGGGTPPSCASTDALRGVGSPGGQCDACPFAEFGSADSGGGQACRASKQLLILRPGTFLPVLLAAPPTSIKVVRQTFLRMASRAVPYYSAIFEFGLEKVPSAAGFEYSRLTLQVARRLTSEERGRVDRYREVLSPLFQTLTVSSAEDVGEEPDK